MLIGKSIIEKVLSMQLDENIFCETMALITDTKPKMLTFLDNRKFIPQAVENQNITAIFVTKEIAVELKETDITKIICDDPRFNFYHLYNYLARLSYKKEKSKIHYSANIHPRAYISRYNVKIGKNVVIEPCAAILPDVAIGDNCIIHAGAILGSEGFEHKKTSRGVLSIFHDGKVILGDNVEIGANNCIDKGLFDRDTIIGNNTKTDNLIHIGHSVHIGENVLITAGVTISGSVIIKNNVWIAPAAAIMNQLSIEDNAFIGIGSVVVKDVNKEQKVFGNPARNVIKTAGPA